MTLPLLTCVVAIAANGVIGREGSLPWRMRDDLKWFRDITMGKPILMGRTTFEDLGRPLPGRRNIVITRRAIVPLPDLICAGCIEDGVDVAMGLAQMRGTNEACVIGGGAIYRQLMPRFDRLYVTRIEAAVDGDTSIDLPTSGYTRTILKHLNKDDRNDHNAVIERWDRQ